MTELATEAAALIHSFGLPVDPGLSEVELQRIEHDGGFRFNPDHRDFLALAVPMGKSWPDWRAADAETLREWLFRPIDGVLFDVDHPWGETWGPRPADLAEQLEVALSHLRRASTMVPIYAHRHCPAAPAPEGSPVFSIHQTDVIHYGSDLVNYLHREFRDPLEMGDTFDIPFLTDITQGLAARP